MLSLTDYQTRHEQLRDELARAEEAYGAASLAEATGTAEKGQIEDAQERVDGARNRLRRLELALDEARKAEGANAEKARVAAYEELRRDVSAALQRRENAAEAVRQASDVLKGAVENLEKETNCAVELMVAHGRSVRKQIDFRQLRNRMRFQRTVGGRLATLLRAHGVDKTHFDASLTGVPDPVAFAQSSADFFEKKVAKWAPDGETGQ